MGETIGQVIRRLRGRRFTQKEIEERSEGRISKAWLASLETDRSKNPRQRERLDELARILGTSVTEIYRLAGLIELSDLSALTEEEKELVEIYRSLTPPERKLVRQILRDLEEARA